jgi:hypothetical protein
MTKDQAITLHLQHWQKFPVFVWQEGDYFVTEVDGKVFRAKSEFLLDIKMGDECPSPRNLYFVDAPDYESNKLGGGNDF